MSGQTQKISMVADIAPEIPYHLIGDPLRIQQIVTNLLSNALKFTEEGSVNLTSYYKKGIWTVSIQDTGVGMTEAQQEGIFDEFTQADLTTTRKFGGTGLGLNICRKLLNIMNGDIKLSSTLGQGSIFKIGIPILEDPTEIKPDQSFTDHLYEVIIINKSSQESDFIQSCLIHWNVGNVNKFQSFMNFDLQSEQYRSNDNLVYLVSVDIYKLLNTEQLRIFRNRKLILLSNSHHDYPHLPHVSLPVKQSELFDNIANLIGLRTVFRTPKSAKEIKYQFDQQMILLVEDNNVNQLIAEMLLTKVNLKVLKADDGQQAVDMVKKHKFELILMDIQMPVMDGLTAAKAIRALPGENAAIPILALTANCFASDIEASEAAGMNGHVGKPIVPELLFFEIEKYLNTNCENVILEPKRVLDDSIWIKDPNNQALLKGMNFDVLLEKTLGNIEFMASILTSFSDEIMTGYYESQTLFDDELLKDCARFFHTLKGTSGNIGANKVFELCTEIDLEFKRKDVMTKAQFTKLSSPIERELLTVIEGINDFISNLPKQKEGIARQTIDHQTFREKLGFIETALYSDASEAERITKELLTCKLPDTAIEQLNLLMIAITNFDYSEMEAIVSGLGETKDISIE